MRRIIVEINCEEKTCDFCTHVAGPEGDLVPGRYDCYCDLFEDELKENDDTELNRCPACLAAEVKEEKECDTVKSR